MQQTKEIGSRVIQTTDRIFSIYSARTNGFHAFMSRLLCMMAYKTSLFLLAADVWSPCLSGPCSDAWLYLCTHNYVCLCCWQCAQAAACDGWRWREKSPGCAADIKISSRDAIGRGLTLPFSSLHPPSLIPDSLFPPFLRIFHSVIHLSFVTHLYTVANLLLLLQLHLFPYWLLVDFSWDFESTHSIYLVENTYLQYN